MDAQNIVDGLADYYRDRPDVVAVYLFGSVARGTSGPRSDVDVGVLYRTAPQSRLMAQPFREEANLAEQLKRAVQIIVMNRASADLVHRVLRDGILVLDQHPSQRIAFEVRARNEYFDLLPTLRRYREGRPRA
ncbi:MAG TPA: nucleotidyltransferase domain-containing protein [Polyangiaceae bacterium]